MAHAQLARTPFYFVGARRYREAELAAYIHREHLRGRRLSAIIGDPYIDRCGGPSVLHAVLLRPTVISTLQTDVVDEIRAMHAELRQPRR